MRIVNPETIVRAYNQIGKAISLMGLELSTSEIIQEMKFIDFEKMYDYRVEKMGRGDESKTIKFWDSNRELKEITISLHKSCGRIDFKNLQSEEYLKIQDLLEIIYLDPETNAMLQKCIPEPTKYSFTKSREKNEICYYLKHPDKSFSCFCKTDLKGNILKLGNKGRILTILLFQFGLFLEVEEYGLALPKTAEEKAKYEVFIMNKYSRKI